MVSNGTEYECYEEPIYKITSSLVDELRERYPDCIVTHDFWQPIMKWVGPKCYQVICQEPSKGRLDGHHYLFRLQVMPDGLVIDAAREFGGQKAKSQCWCQMAEITYDDPKMMSAVTKITDKLIEVYRGRFGLSMVDESIVKGEYVPKSGILIDLQLLRS